MAEIYGERAPGAVHQRSNWSWIALAVIVVLAILIALAIWR